MTVSGPTSTLSRCYIVDASVVVRGVVATMKNLLRVRLPTPPFTPPPPPLFPYLLVVIIIIVIIITSAAIETVRDFVTNQERLDSGVAGVKFNPLMGTGNYSATSNNMKLVHWPLMGGLLRLVQR